MYNKLKEIRTSKNMSQVDVANLVDIPISTYHMYETGNRKIPKDIANELAKKLNIQRDDIFLAETFTIRKSDAKKDVSN